MPTSTVLLSQANTFATQFMSSVGSFAPAAVSDFYSGFMPTAGGGSFFPGVCINAADAMATIQAESMSQTSENFFSFTPFQCPPEILARMTSSNKYCPQMSSQTFSSNGSSSSEESARYHRRIYEQFRKMHEKYKNFEQTHKETIDTAKEFARGGGLLYSFEKYSSKKEAKWRAEDEGYENPVPSNWNDEIELAASLASYGYGSSGAKSKVAAFAKEIKRDKDWVTAAGSAAIEAVKQVALNNELGKVVANTAAVALSKLSKPLGYLHSFKIYEAKKLAENALEITKEASKHLENASSALMDLSELLYEQAESDLSNVATVEGINSESNSRFLDKISEMTIAVGLLENTLLEEPYDAVSRESLDDLKVKRNGLLGLYESLIEINPDSTNTTTPIRDAAPKLRGNSSAPRAFDFAPPPSAETFDRVANNPRVALADLCSERQVVPDLNTPSNLFHTDGFGMSSPSSNSTAVDKVVAMMNAAAPSLSKGNKSPENADLEEREGKATKLG